MRQNLEKNIEKVVAITLSLGMVALNTCSNGGYSYRVNNILNDKNKSNVAYASELTSPETDNSIECDDLESKEALQEVKSAAPAIVHPASSKTRVSSQPKVIVKEAISQDANMTTPAIEEEPLNVDDIWDKLIKDYEEYEITDVDTVNIPDEENYVTIDDEIVEPDVDPEDFTPLPEVTESVVPDVPDNVNNSDTESTNVLTEPEVVSTPELEIKPIVEEKPETELTPMIVVTPFGTHIQVDEKPVCQKPEVSSKIENVDPPESDKADHVEDTEPPTDNVNIVIMNEQDEFLSKIPAEGVNGYSKDLIKTLIYSGLGVVAVAAIIGVPWLIHT